MDHVVRAENNMEETIISGSTTNQHAIFIDRDPKHFDMILTYLRNKADGIYRQPGIAQRLMKSLDVTPINKWFSTVKVDMFPVNCQIKIYTVNIK